ncbi:flavin reductase (DIM6/NTAB) family NADH-FMN oxidoreductase RutF [Catenuloplanes nepalensis]|uniref:Flavin reductase (DIM6/NTAB) family NADH-FMN oxidoreductase RutF n=1 Tax=Catenuloplanes nepalensis TaxID=587533 RepID=A0ABT9N7A1_9ACTN|nr:flavin reductase family protein [Catenuloplanes nepalensis]MDP9799586.1 flavin reductase (DIM6/NTAB) family NADH-FMN oxidoreductase RutF [Catenuloplanes nepalensis]
MVDLRPVGDDPAALRAAYGCFPSGVTAVCALVDGAPAGLAASSFTSVSMSPPLVSVCVQHTSTTWPRLRHLDRVGVSVLGEDHDALARQIASRTGDRFAGVAWEAGPGGAVFLGGATAWLDCTVERQVPAGDHDIVLLRVHTLRADPDVAPLVFHASRFRQLAAPRLRDAA